MICTQCGHNWNRDELLEGGGCPICDSAPLMSASHVYGGVTGWAKGTITRCQYCGYAVQLVERGYAVGDYTIEWETWSHMRHDPVCQQPKPVSATSIDRFLASYG